MTYHSAFREALDLVYCCYVNNRCPMDKKSCRNLKCSDPKEGRGAPIIEILCRAGLAGVFGCCGISVRNHLLRFELRQHGLDVTGHPGEGPRPIQVCGGVPQPIPQLRCPLVGGLLALQLTCRADGGG
jgi:hypothetical protein